MVEKHTCRNGVRVVLEQIPNVRSVTIGIWVLTGSRHETSENNGISHFLEHMLFKGTKKRSAQQIAEAFDSIGGQVNAFTSKEYTCYYARVIDTHKEFALDVLSDMFFNSIFDEAELEREKKVVLEEIKMYEDTPDDNVHDLLAQASFGKHPLGRTILGTSDHIHSFNSDSLHNYINYSYNPEDIVVSIAGNVDNSFLNTVEGYFDRFRNEKADKSIKQPLFLSENISKHKEIEQAHVCFGYNGLAIDNDDITSLLVLNNALGGSMSSRLFQEVREQQGLAYSVFSFHSAYLDSGLLTIYAGTGKDRIKQLQQTISEIILQLLDKGLTDKELQNSREQLKGNIMLSLESTNSRMSRNGRNELLLGKHRTLDEIISEINGVGHESVNDVIQRVFSDTPATALISPQSD